uniref:Uncharacterized protein n=1 Tax=Branchiostoma floridae TaxID=7739 RepID=C3YZ83_BRAFL|eukprot:XP_002598142.1 hypothetical protein BRAFLDRAFT_82925 [Branchiostoma floridae]
MADTALRSSTAKCTECRHFGPACFWFGDSDACLTTSRGSDDSRQGEEPTHGRAPPLMWYQSSHEFFLGVLMVFTTQDVRIPSVFHQEAGLGGQGRGRDIREGRAPE